MKDPGEPVQPYITRGRDVSRRVADVDQGGGGIGKDDLGSTLLAKELLDERAGPDDPLDLVAGALLFVGKHGGRHAAGVAHAVLGLAVAGGASVVVNESENSILAVLGVGHGLDQLRGGDGVADLAVALKQLLKDQACSR